MAVHFVYRSDGWGPSDLHRRRFDDGTVIDWFRRHWRPIADDDEALRYAKDVLGADVYSFDGVFRYAAANPEPPTDIADVLDALESCDHVEIRSEEHCVQVLSNDDEYDMAYYFFDDAFVKGHPDLTAFLLHDGPLPDGAGEPGWQPANRKLARQKPAFRKKGEGCLYVLTQCRDDSSMYEDLDQRNVKRFAGLRLPELCRQLMNLSEERVEEWGYLFIRLYSRLFAKGLAGEPQERAFVKALQAQPADEATWRAYADWLMEGGGPDPGVRLLRLALPRLEGWGTKSQASKNVVGVGEHVAQASIHEGARRFALLVLFDDLWAGAHPALADALLRYFTRWDVLSTGNEQSSE